MTTPPQPAPPAQAEMPQEPDAPMRMGSISVEGALYVLHLRAHVSALLAHCERLTKERDGALSKDNGAWSKAALVIDGIANGEAAKLLLAHYGFKSDQAWGKAMRAELEELLHLNSVQADNVRRERERADAAEAAALERAVMCCEMRADIHIRSGHYAAKVTKHTEAKDCAAAIRALSALPSKP